MKKQLINDTKVWMIEVVGDSYEVQYGGVGNQLRVNKKTFDTEEKCIKEAEKALNSKLKSGYIELTLDIPKVDLDILYHVQQAQAGESTSLKIENWTHVPLALLYEICKCTALETLIIRTKNDFPKEINQLKNLKHLEIDGWDNAKLPSTITELTNLEELSLVSLTNKTLSSEFGNLANLKKLTISYCKEIDGIPDSIGNLQKLKEFSFNNNRTEDYGSPLPTAPTIPSSIGLLKNLETFNLEDNCFIDLPVEFGQLTGLRTLEMNNNHFTKIPLSVCALSGLQTLEIECETLTEIPKEFLQMTSLTKIELECDPVTNIPQEVLSDDTGFMAEINIGSIRKFLGEGPQEKINYPIPPVSENKIDLVKERHAEIDKVFSNIEEEVSDSELKNVFALKKYITGESDILPESQRKTYDDYEEIISLLKPLDSWNFIDERIISFIGQEAFFFEKPNRYSDKLSERGFHEDFFDKWFIPLLKEEKEDQDFFSEIMDKLTKMEISEEIVFSAFLSESTNLEILHESNKPNSVGRYLINQLEKDTDFVFDLILKHSLRTPFVQFLLSTNSPLLDKSLEKFLTIMEYEGSGDTHLHIPFYILEIVCKYDIRKYENYALRLIEQSDCHECIIECYRILFENDPEKYREKTLEKAIETLAIISTKHNEGTYHFPWSLGAKHGENTAPFIGWLHENFGDVIFESVYKYVKNTKIIDTNVINSCIICFGHDAIKMVAEAFKVTPNSNSVDHFETLFDLIKKLDYTILEPKIWEIAGCSEDTIADLACKALAKTSSGNIVAQALEKINDKKDKVRMAAVKILLLSGDQTAIDALKPLLQTEKKDNIRDIVVEIVYGKQLVENVSISDMQERIAQAKDLGKLDKPTFTWLGTLPSLLWTNGTELTEEEINYIFYRQKSGNTIEPEIEVIPVFQHINKESGEDFATKIWHIIEEDGGLVAKNKATFAFLGLFANEKITKEFGQLAINKNNINACEILALMNNEVAALTLDQVMKTHEAKQNATFNAAEIAFASVAQNMGMTEVELQEKMLPTFGFTSRSLTITESGEDYELFISPDIHFLFKNTTGKIIKSIPKASTDHKKEQKTRESELKKANKHMLRAMEANLVTQKNWSANDWSNFFLQHPLAFAYAQSTVWTINETKHFIVLSDGKLIDENKNEISLVENDAITMAHPALMDKTTLDDWLDLLFDLSVQSSFEQLSRTVHLLPDELKDTKMCDLFLGKQQNASTFKSRTNKRGWRRGSVVDGGGVSSYLKTFSAHNIDVFIDTENLSVTFYGHDEQMDFGHFYFVKKGEVAIGSYTYDNPRKEDDVRLIPFKEVPLVVYSEMMSDLIEFVR